MIRALRFKERLLTRTNTGTDVSPFTSLQALGIGGSKKYVGYSVRVVLQPRRRRKTVVI
jgi:hypothetical protein